MLFMAQNEVQICPMPLSNCDIGNIMNSFLQARSMFYDVTIRDRFILKAVKARDTSNRLPKNLLNDV